MTGLEEGVDVSTSRISRVLWSTGLDLNSLNVWKFDGVKRRARVCHRVILDPRSSSKWMGSEVLISKALVKNRGSD